jgi:hypothetical protein
MTQQERTEECKNIFGYTRLPEKCCSENYRQNNSRKCPKIWNQEIKKRYSCNTQFEPTRHDWKECIYGLTFDPKEVPPPLYYPTEEDIKEWRK